MPCLEISTNVKKDKVPADFFQVLTEKLAAAIEKPIGYCVVHLHTDEAMTWGGTNDPCATINLKSIGFKKTPHAITQLLGPYVCESLGVPKDRYYMFFTDLPADNVGYTHMSFTEIRKAAAKK